MAKTAVALYDTKQEAQQVQEELTHSGFERNSIQILEDNDSNSQTTLTNAGLPQRDAHAYVEGIRRGGSLVVLTTSDDRIGIAVDIMDRHHSINIQERVERWRSEGWGEDPDTEESMSGRQLNATGRQSSLGAHQDDEQTEALIPVVDKEYVNGERRPINRAARKEDFNPLE